MFGSMVEIGPGSEVGMSFVQWWGDGECVLEMAMLRGRDED